MFSRIGPPVVSPLVNSPASRARSGSSFLRQDLSKFATGVITQRLARGLVTSATLAKIQKAIPGKVEFSETPPYQGFGDCDKHALEILAEQMRKHGTRKPADAAPGFSISGWLSQLGKGSFVAAAMHSADDLLEAYREHGSYVLRGPGLGQSYGDHAVLVFAVTTFKSADGQQRRVLAVLDCEDLAGDPDTTASRAQAAAAGLEHVSKLTHEDARRNGAEERRVRLIDLDHIAAHVNKFYTALINEGVENIDPPVIKASRTEKLALTPQEEEEFREIVKSVYDSEVEK